MRFIERYGDWVSDLDGVSNEERDRIRRMHEAGEIPPGLELSLAQNNDEAFHYLKQADTCKARVREIVDELMGYEDKQLKLDFDEDPSD